MKPMVLITRPPVLASELADALANLPVFPLILPTVAIEKLTIAPKVIQQLRQAKQILVTSRHAAESLAPLWSKLKNQAVIYAIGEGTQLKLHEYGVEANLPTTAFNSEGLLALPSLQNLAGQTLAVVTGAGGRQILIPSLTARGARVVAVVGYRRLQPHYQASMLSQIRAQPLQLIISTSSESLLNLFEIFGVANRAWLQNLQYLLISQRMLATADKLGINRAPIICQSASVPAIVWAVKAWYDDEIRANEDG